MIPAERRQKMLSLISEQGAATIAQLRGIFSVSEMTIHRDLKFLEAKGQVEKTYGGVIARLALVETDFERRRHSNIEAKRLIAKEAIKLIDDGDILLIDASSTCLALIPELASKNKLTVFTTGVTASLHLLEIPGIDLFCTGGHVQDGTNSYCGSGAVEVLKNIHVDKCFMGAAGICPPYGITDPIQEVAETKKYSALASNEVIVLADHTKFGRITKFNVLPFKDIDLIITDATEETPCIKETKEIGVELLLVDSKT